MQNGLAAGRSLHEILNLKVAATIISFKSNFLIGHRR